jgi:DNA-binding winged helix-turn-helix (wHTH) protein
MRFGPFEFHAAARRLICRGKDVHLTPKAFDLLELLISAAPGVVAKSEIHERLWPNQIVSDATLVGLIKELRRACKDRDPDLNVIRTVHRVGYALDCEIAPVAESEKVAGLLFIGPRRLRLVNGLNLVGRNADCEVWIDNAKVSRKHARIVIDGDRVTIEDLGSKNGTRVEDEPFDGLRELQDGDRIQFGGVDAIFRDAKSSLPTETQATRADI